MPGFEPSIGERGVRLERLRAPLICSIALVLYRLLPSLRHRVRMAGLACQVITCPTPEQQALLEAAGIAPPKHPT